MYEFFLPSLADVFQWHILLGIALGVIGGLVIGSIPGLTSTMAIALLVPVTFTMDTTQALTLLMGVYCGAISGGLVAAIVLNIPGTPASASTCLDGYPMSQKGKTIEALGIGVYSSMIGGTISGLALVLIAPLLAMFAMKFGPWEYFSLVIFTFSCISALAAGSPIKAFLAAGIGIIISLIGTDPANGILRFTFGIDGFESGFNVLPALIGIYAIPQLLSDVDDVGKKSSSAAIVFDMKKFTGSFAVVLSRKVDLLRSTLIGIVIGILPGVGPGLSNIVAYGQARNASKTPEKFGTGELPEAIMAPEAGNNASMGGALIPMLTLGIPGDASTLMMLGAFMLHDLQPGPLLFRDNGDVVWIIFIAFFVAFFFCTIFYHFFIGVIIKVLSIPQHYVIPVLLVLCTIGSYALNNRMFDVYSFLGFGLLGYVLKTAKYPVLPVILGLILGHMAEEQLKLSLELSDGNLMLFFTRPISCVLLIMAGSSFILPAWMDFKKKKVAEISTI